MSSSSSHAIVTYTSMSSDDDVLSWGIPLMDAYESNPEAPEAAPQSLDQAPLSPAHAPVYPEYLAPSDDDLEPAEAQSLPVSVSLTTLLPNYLADSEPVEEDPKKDPEEDPKEEPSEEEKEELLAPADSPPIGLYTDLQSEVEEDKLVAPAPPLPPPSPLSPLSSLLPRIQSPPLLLPPLTRRDIIPEAKMPPRKRARFAAPSHRFEIGESSAAAAVMLVMEFESTHGNNEETSSKAMLAIDGVGFDWSDMAKEQSLNAKGMVSEVSKKRSNVVCDKKLDDSKENSDNSLVKEQVSKDTSSFVESSLNVDKETIFFVDKKVESVKPKNHEKLVKKSVSFRSCTAQCNTIKSGNDAKAQAVNTARQKTVKTARPNSTVVNAVRVNQANAVKGKPQQDDTGFVDSGCSRHMTGNIAYLSDFKEFDGGYISLVN
ncbi:hypothetical protein Tco_0844409 [Tanacetum coccineum]